MVDTEEYIRPRSYRFLQRIRGVMNMSELARLAGDIANKDSFYSRVRRNSDLSKSLDAKAESEAIAEVLNELWYIIGVGIGKLPEDRKKEYKYFNDDWR